MNKERLFEYITRNVLKRLTLNESDDRADRVKKVIDATFKNHNDVIPETSPLYNSNNPNRKWRDHYYFNLRRSFGLMTNGDLNILDFIAPIAYSNEVKFDIDDSKQVEQNKLKEIVLLLKDKSNGVFEKELKGKEMSFEKLCEIAEPHIQEKKQQEDYELENGDFSGGGDYDILEDVDFETAHKYGMMSCSKGPICYTEKEHTWNTYKNKGRNKCYILLRKGWENVKEEHTQPKYDFLICDACDEYGLSMIFVFVDPNNDIATCNTRWNHHARYCNNRSVDKALNKVDISKLIGKSFNSVFKGYTEEDGILIATFENAQELLDRGYKPENIFKRTFRFDDGFTRIEIDDMCNLINPSGKIISTRWFDGVGDFKEGFAKVMLDNKYNFINTNGEILSKQWFDFTHTFVNGVALVKLNGKYNFINNEGEILSNKGFDEVHGFKEGFALVKLDGKYNFINTEGDLLRDQWFDYASDFDNGTAYVMLNYKQHHIDKNGNIIR